MKQLEVQIMGTSYVLSCPEEDEPQLLNAVALVDSTMCKIRNNGKTKARERVAVLAALNIAADTLKKEQQSQAVSIPEAHQDLLTQAAYDATLTPDTKEAPVDLPDSPTTPASETVPELISRIDQALAEENKP